VNELDPLEPAAPAAPEAGRAFPWPPGEDESILTAFTDTWRGATLSPTQFFRSLPRDGRIGPALLYYLPLGIAVAGAGLFWGLVLPSAEEMAALGGFGQLGGESGMDPVIEFLMSPLLLLFSLFVSAGVTHMMLALFGGAKHGLSTTVRVFAFAYSPNILGVVPYAGELVGWVWMIVIAIIGLREAHGTGTGRAAAAVLVPLTVALFLFAVAMFIAATTSILLPQ